jgi:1,4-alpha-glucan branching enzyme
MGTELAPSEEWSHDGELDWQRFANLRLLYAYQWATPGKKLLFTGCEFGQRTEWNEEREIDWHCLADPRHAGIQRLVDRLNELYRSLPALHELDTETEGFRWLEADDPDGGVIAYQRRGRSPKDIAICVLNTVPIVKHDHLIGAPLHGAWLEVLNTDAQEYGGSGAGNMGRVETRPVPHQGEPHALRLTLPPLGAIILTAENGSSENA